jgi:transaldolase
VDVYAEKHFSDLSSSAQGFVGIVNAKRIWSENQEFWRDKILPLQQGIVFASTGVKKLSDPPDKYVQAFAGGDILTNPPATNQAVYESPKVYTRQIDFLPAPSILKEIDEKVDMVELEKGLLEEGIRKFADPQRALLKLIQQKRKSQFAHCR